MAAAFKEKVKPHPTLVELIRGYFKTDDLTSPAMKMAHVCSTESLKYLSTPRNPYCTKSVSILG